MGEGFNQMLDSVLDATAKRAFNSRECAEWLLVLLMVTTILLGPRMSVSIYSWIARIAHDFSDGRYYIPGRRECETHVVVSDQKLVREVSEASELSQRAVYGDMFGFESSLGNKFDKNEVKLARTRLFRRFLQLSGPRELRAGFDGHLGVVESNFPRSESGRCVSVPLKAFCEDTMFDLYSRIFYGAELCRDETFMAAIKQHPRDLINTLLCLKMTPSIIRKPIINLVTKGGRALDEAMKRLLPTFGRVAAGTSRSEALLELMGEAAAEDREYWTPHRLAQALLGIWLAASFQPSNYLYFTIIALCEHPEYTQPLRDELSAAGTLDYDKLMTLPLLDSFVKEAARHRPLDTMNVRRKALRPCTFSNGQHVPVGTVACIDSAKFLSDEGNYPDAARFDAFRFLRAADSRLDGNKDASASVGGFTEVSEAYPIWGFGSLACPGRFHAAFSIKLTVALLVSRYDFSLADPSKRPGWTWDSFTLSKSSTRLLMRLRGSATTITAAAAAAAAGTATAVSP